MKVEFEGAVTCEPAQGAVNLLMRARDREMLFSGAETAGLAPTLHDVRITQLTCGAEGDRWFRIESAEVDTQLRARCVQIHRDAAAAMFAAVPPVRVPLRLRAGWAVLLSILRVPGVGRLILGRAAS